MKMLLVGPDLFHTDERTDRQTDRHDEAKQSLFAILRTRLKT